ncbi:MAG: ABC-F family ATP-binding cassette domain-containing protein, partial [Vallitaleaceae bacterium]|nr:ABC-F family ATP-binding cassette domain-containing protein [Vallitaleaceae bacterium]
GKIKLGFNVHVGYYDQEHSLLNPENNLIDEISDDYPEMNIGDIRNVLAAFLFTRDDVFKLTDSLSGGEKGRLTLAKLMLSQSNFLLLDEPTNHLDVVSREVLEDTLNNYTGTLFFISHDRYFINQIATRVLDLTPSGVESYTGNYDYYIEKRNEKLQLTAARPNDSQVQKPNKDQWMLKKEEDAQKRKKEKQIEKTETEIHTIDARIATIDALLCQEDVYTNHIKATELTDEKSALETTLGLLYEQWDMLLES